MSVDQNKRDARTVRAPEAMPPGPTKRFLARAKTRVERELRFLLAHSRAVHTSPSVATFDAQLGVAGWPATLLGIAVVGAVAGVLYNLQHPMVDGVVGAIAEGLVLGPFVWAAIFFCGGAVFQGIARLFGGAGSFMSYSFLLLLAWGPLAIISAVANLLPILGGIVAVVAAFYGFALTLMATTSAHRLSLGRSVAVVLAGLIVIAILLFVAFLVVVVVSLKTL